jgi:hypothetical protein
MCYMSMESHDGMIWTSENSWFLHQSTLAILPAELSSSKQENVILVESNGNSDSYVVVTITIPVNGSDLPR